MAKEEDLQRKLGSMFPRTRGWNKDTGSGWRMIQSGEHAGKWQLYKDWEAVEGYIEQNPEGLLNVADFSPSGWDVVNYGESLAGAGWKQLTKLEREAQERKKAEFEERSKTHYQTETRRGHKRWVPKTKEMLEAEQTDWDKQFDVKGRPAIDYFTQAIENDLELDDFKRETLLKSRLSFENAYQFEDATTDFVKATELAELVKEQGDTNLFTGNINYLDNTASTSDGTSDGDTSITNNIVENQTATGALTDKDDEEITVEKGDANQMTIGSKPWVRGKGTSYKDANAATEELMKKEGYDLRGLGISQKQDLFSAYRSGRTHKTDKGLFHNQKLLRKR